MGKCKMWILAGLLAAGSAIAAPSGSGIQKYVLKEFVADFTHFTIGDAVPEMYRTDQYNIKQWQLRNLPAPDAGTHWTYMGGNYVLIGDADGKISKVYDGEIFYHR
jgi:Predicted integral membrane protein